MSSSSSSWKRNSHSISTARGISNINSDSHRHTHPAVMERLPLAIKLRKRMLQESGKDGAGGKRIRTKDCDRNTLCNFGARQSVPCVDSSHGFQRLQQSQNLIHYLYAASLGFVSITNRKSVLGPIVRELQDLRLFKAARLFDDRVTALEWHPTIPNMALVGSKTGDLFCWNTLHQKLNGHFIRGKRGSALGITGIKVHPFNSQQIFTSSLDCEVNCLDIHLGTKYLVLKRPYCWYCCIDVNGPKKVMVMGDENGIASLLSLDGKELWTHSLHNGKMTHVEFFPGNDWWFCTASVDGTVKVWDLRKVTGEWDALHVLKHDSAVNVAHFSRTDGCRLLTSDQFNQIRVYRLPAWHLEQKIERPSCFFQHDIPIKPSWHPLKDLIVVGRYPSNSVPSYPSSTENSCRNIDMIDIDTGKMQCQLFNPSFPGIVSLNRFSDRGDYMVSAWGLRALLWGRGQEE